MECKDGICTVIPVNKLKCPNFIVCKNRVDTTYDYEGLCMDCYSLFGKWRNFNTSVLKIEDYEVKCPLCDIVDINIKRPNCDHTLCINCFRKLYYGIELEKPSFGDDNFLDKITYWNKFKKLFESSASSKCFECSFS